MRVEFVLTIFDKEGMLSTSIWFAGVKGVLKRNKTKREKREHERSSSVRDEFSHKPLNNAPNPAVLIEFTLNNEKKCVII